MAPFAGAMGIGFESRMTMAVWLSVLCLWTGLARAVDVDSSMESDGAVRVTALLAHDLTKVKTFLADTDATMRLGKDIRDVTIKPGPDGCVEMTVVNTSFRREFSYVAHRCATEHGWRSTMIRSEHFAEHDIEWTILPEGDGTRLVIQVRVRPRFPVPQFLIRRVIVGALTGTMEKLDTLLGE